MSLLQKHLSKIGHGNFTIGGPVAENLDREIRVVIDNEVEVELFLLSEVPLMPLTIALASHR